MRKEKFAGMFCLGLGIVLSCSSVYFSYDHLVSTGYPAPVAFVIAVSFSAMPMVFALTYPSIWKSSRFSFCVMLIISLLCVFLSRGQIVSSVNRVRLVADSYDVNDNPIVKSLDRRVSLLQGTVNSLRVRATDQAGVVFSMNDAGQELNAAKASNQIIRIDDHIADANKMITFLSARRDSVVNSSSHMFGLDNYSLGEKASVGVILTPLVGGSVDILSICFGLLSTILSRGRRFLPRHRITVGSECNNKIKYKDILNDIPRNVTDCVRWYYDNGCPANWQIILANHCYVSPSTMSRSIKDYSKIKPVFTGIVRNVAASS